jgi:phosphoribosylamine--glycine ligase
VRVLILGGGGREHALAWALRRSPLVSGLFVAPGNGGTDSLAENVPVDPQDLEAVLDIVVERDIDLTVVGPEAPLVDGIADRLAEKGRLCFGPSKDAARLEGSKVFAKEFMRRHGIPTAEFSVFDDAAAAKRYVRDKGCPIVIKADGLAQGKGVVVAADEKTADAALDSIMVERKHGASGERVVVETCLEGDEVSVHAVCDGDRAVLFPPSQDHKRIFENDRGPNTGGMGAYAPVPFLTKDLLDEIHRRIIVPTLRGMKAEGTPYCGVLYAGLMITPEGPSVLEFNVRFGDPETQVILPLLKSDLLALLHRTAGHLPPDPVQFHEDRFAACVVAAAQGYPGAYEKGIPIRGLEDADDERRIAFHAGTAKGESGWVTSGGRVLGMTAWGRELAEALHHAYGGLGMIRFRGAYWRKDIGHRAL